MATIRNTYLIGEKVTADEKIVNDTGLVPAAVALK